MPKPISVLIGLLALLAVGTVAALATLLLRDPAARAPAAETDSPFIPSRPPLAYTPEAIGLPMVGNPVITQVDIADLDQDGLPDVMVCDATANRIGWIRQHPRGVFTEQSIGDSIAGPAHVSACDINRDGRLDLLVAGMGMILPNNDRIGKVVVLENLGDGQFRTRVLAENIARVTDVRGADLNDDGQIDLVVGQFGFDQGEIRWMENRGNWEFHSHLLLDEPGTIMNPVADFDHDGKLDFAALVSQDAEAIHRFRNIGGGKFTDDIVWKAKDENWGSSGLDTCDLNHDGWTDLVYSNGDGFSIGFTEPYPWHGLAWLENRYGAFSYHRIGDMAGCYSPDCADLDGDGDIDIVAVSGFNHVIDPASVWMTAWLNDGHQRFTPVPLATTPTRLITLAAADLDGDGVPELVTGGFHTSPPYTQMSRVTLWRRR